MEDQKNYTNINDFDDDWEYSIMLDIIVKDQKRFWSNVNITDNFNDCWEWIGPLVGKGYGYFSTNTDSFAHRYIFQLYNGNVKSGNYVCHKCDNPKCVNPTHLFEGSPKDNYDDMKNKGRDNHVKGSKISKAKLTEKDIEVLLNNIISGKYNNVSKILIDYKVTRAIIYKILNGKIWKHVTCNFNLDDIKNKVTKSRTDNARKLTNEQIQDIKNRLNNGETGYSIAKLYGLSNGAIYSIKYGRTWK